MRTFETALGLLLVFLDAVFGAICGQRCWGCARTSMTVRSRLCFSCVDYITHYGACLGCSTYAGEDHVAWLMRTIRTLSKRITKLELER